MMIDDLKLHVIICSTRPGRIGPAVARWARDLSVRHGRFRTALVDLADYRLPVFDEAEHPRLGKYQHAHTAAWSESVDAADAFVFVTPEYNHGFPSAAINAITYLSSEWHYKPAGFVSYGGFSGGIRAIEAAKPLLAAVKMMPILESVVIPQVTKQLDGTGKFLSHDRQETAASVMLEELHRWTQALRTLRST